MSEHSPRPSDNKRSLIAPLIVGALVLALLAVSLVLQHRSAPAPAPPPPAVEPTPPLVPVEAAPQPLTRKELIEAAADRAAAYADGVSANARDALVGRTFAMRIPFGCGGPQLSAGSAQAYFEYDAAKRTLRLVARPGEWTTLPMISALGEAQSIEHVEGFWLQRPWSYSEACPVRRDAPAPASPTAAAAPTLGLAQLFDVDSSRVQRRDSRPYEFVRKVPEGELPPLTQSYRLVLEGRIVGFANGRASACWSESPEHRPICVFGVAFDRIAFEDTKGQTLAEWKG